MSSEGHTHFSLDRVAHHVDAARLAKYRPQRKVSASALAGALAIILVWFLNAFMVPESKAISGEVAAALTTVLTFAVGYMVPEA